MLQRHISVVLAALALSLTACGQKGPLSLPDPMPPASAASAPSR